jgi:tetratricopeptide (TPR) repeat protein
MSQEAEHPSFRTIASLFQIPTPEEFVEEEDEPRAPKVGRTADESDALGRACLTDGNYEAAIKHFQRACTQREPGDIRSQIDLAGAMEYADQAPQALRQYQRALQIQHEALEPELGISDVLRRYGRYRESIEHLQEAVKKEPGNPYVHIKLAETLRDAGHPVAALTAAQGAIAAKPDGAFYHYWTGDLLTSMKRYDEALDALRAAIELSPGDDFLYLRAAVAFWGANRTVEAIKSVRLASDLDPAKHLYHGLLGVLLEETGQLEDSQLESDRAKLMDRYDQDMLDRLLDEMGIEL